VTGIECLLRWQHPNVGLVLPDQLVPLAEETGLIVPIGQWALRAACLQAQKWAGQGLPMFRMAVNLSARQFVSATLLEDVAGTIRETGMDPRWIEFEVTESVMLPDPQQAVKLLRNLKAMGVRLTIDDFGTGYSSLAYLKRLPIDCVKIDASFIRGIPVDASDVAITETILAMARSLRLKVVAEGVETLDQARFLERGGCDEMQGYYFSKPLPAEELTTYLKEQGAALEESRRGEASGRLRVVSGGDRRSTVARRDLSQFFLGASRVNSPPIRRASSAPSTCPISLVSVSSSLRSFARSSSAVEQALISATSRSAIGPSRPRIRARISVMARILIPANTTGSFAAGARAARLTTRSSPTVSTNPCATSRASALSSSPART